MGHATLYVTDEASLERVVNRIKASRVAVYDMETTTLDMRNHDASAVSLAVTLDGVASAAVPLFHPESWCEATWRETLTRVAQALATVPVIVGHNVKFDNRVVKALSGVVLPYVESTDVQGHLLDENMPNNLKGRAMAEHGAEEWGINVAGKEWWLKLPLADILKYNLLDTWHTWRLWVKHTARLEREPKLHRIYRNLSIPLGRVSIDMEDAGMAVSEERLIALRDSLTETIRGYDDKLDSFITVDAPEKMKKVYGPSNYLKWYLYEALGLPVIDQTDKGAVSTSKATLTKLADHHEAASILLDRSRDNGTLTKFVLPYLKQIKEEPTLYTNFHLTGTVTGRLSSGKIGGAKDGINIQQVSKAVKSVFISGEDVFLEVDYSQVELRLVAELSQDTNMLNAYKNNEDLHRKTAIAVTGRSDVSSQDRRTAKSVNFGFLYGMREDNFIGYAKTTYHLDVTKEEATEQRRVFFSLYPGLLPWYETVKAELINNGYVTDMFGRRRRLPDVYSRSWKLVNSAYRQAINFKVQGLAAEICMMAISRLPTLPGYGIDFTPLCTVHDSVLFRVRRSKLAQVTAMIIAHMEDMRQLSHFGARVAVPIKVEASVGLSWGEMTELPAHARSVSDVTAWLAVQRPLG